MAVSMIPEATISGADVSKPLDQLFYDIETVMPIPELAKEVGRGIDEGNEL